MLSSSDLYMLLNYTTFVESSFLGISVTGLVYMRYSRPELTRPIKVSGRIDHHPPRTCTFKICFQVNLFFPIFFILITVFLIVMPLLSSPFECLMGVVVTLSGIPVYLLAVSWKDKPKAFTNCVGEYWSSLLFA